MCTCESTRLDACAMCAALGEGGPGVCVCATSRQSVPFCRPGVQDE